jgi:hypothetical protein
MFIRAVENNASQTVTAEGEGKIVRLPGGYVLPPLAGTVTAQPSPTK